MVEKNISTQIPNTGVPSPYALAELVLRRRIDWDTVPNRPALLEEILQTPYENLFDPTLGSPLYIDQNRNKDGTVSRSRPEFANEIASDAKRNANNQVVSNLAELVDALGEKQLAEIPVRALASGLGGRLIMELGESLKARSERFGRLFRPELIDILFPKFEQGYHPAGMTWKDGGRFYNEAAEFFDPVQGAVGDCYLIAALSSVAWARPFAISDAVRATGGDNESFSHRLTFYNSGAPQNFEVTDKILIDDNGNIPFCHSSESGETWPSLYEKAYAKMRLGEASDFPAIPNIAGGDPVGASAQLTGLSPTYMWHSSFTAAEVLASVQSHSSHGRTTSPMTAWTYGSGPEGDVAYRDANVVAGHAYSVLGSMRRYEFRFDRIEHIDRFDIKKPIFPIDIPDVFPPKPEPGPFLQLSSSGLLTATRFAESKLINHISIKGLVPVDYLIVRNPWGFFEATGSSTAGGSHQARDIDWWRNIQLGSNGVFAIEVNAFHRYFAGIGFAS
jgi:Calpain family cysteine protease